MYVHTFPQASVAEDDAEADAGASYQLEMMKCLREVNADNNTVGWCVRVGVAQGGGGWPRGLHCVRVCERGV